MELSSNLLKEFAAITNDQQGTSDGITAYGTAVVSNGQAYVILDGSTIATPVNTLISVENNDRVSVKIKNHEATIVGDMSYPSKTRPDKSVASVVTQYYLSTSEEEVTGGTGWYDTAEDYEAGHYFWTRAYVTWSDGSTPVTSTPVLASALNSLLSTTDLIETAVNMISGQLDTVQDAAKDAKDAADAAQRSANNAYDDAGRALSSLSTVQDIVGILNWTAEQGSGSMADYILSHLSLTGEGLWVQLDNSSTRLLLSSQRGIVLYDSGYEVAKYASEVVIGKTSDKHIKISPSGGLQFYEGSTLIAWIDLSVLHIDNAEIQTSLRVGPFLWKKQSDTRISLVYSPVVTS